MKPRHYWFCIFCVQLCVAFTAVAQPESSPSHPEAIRLYNSAVEFQNQGLFGLAADEWKDLLARHSDDPLAPKAGYYLGTCYFQSAEYPDAAKAFAEVIKKYPDFEQRSAALTNLGLARFNAAQQADDPKQYQQAAAAFSEHLAKYADDPLVPQSRFYLAESQYSIGEKEKALATYADWLNKHPGTELEPQVRLALAGTAIELNKFGDAIEPLTKLLESQPDEQTAATARVRLGEAYLGLNKLAEAREEFIAAAKADFPDADYAQQQAGTAAYGLGQIAEAGQLYAQVAVRFPQSPLVAESLTLAARCAVESGDAAGALKLTKQATQAGAKGAEVAHWHVRAQIESGGAAGALQTTDAVLGEDLNDADRQLLLLDKADALYAITDRRGESLAAYEQAAKGDADPVIAAHALHLAAATALELGKLAEAQRFSTEYRQRFATGTDLADTLQVLAEAQLQQADAQDAATTYAALIESTDASDPRRAEWTVRYAWALFTSDQFEKVAEAVATLSGGEGKLAAEAAYLGGRSQFQLKQYDAAIGLLKDVAAGESPFAAESLLLVGQSQLALSSAKDALATFTSGTQRFADSPLADRFLFRQGEAAATLAEWNVASKAFADLLQRFPESPLAPYALYQQARGESAQGNHKAAADLLAGFASKYADHPLVGNAMFVRATALQQLGQHDEAIRLLAGAPKGAIDGNRLTYAEAVSLAGAGRHAEAAERLESLRTSAPGYLVDKVLYELAFAYKNNKQLDKSLATFAQLSQAAPDSPLAAEAQFRQGEIVYDRGEFAAAAEHFASASDGKVDASLKSQAQHLEGWSHLKAKQFEAAAAAWKSQLDTGQSSELATDARWLVGEAQFQSGKFAEALATFDEAGDDLPTAPSLAPLVLLHAGQAAGQVGKWQASHDWLEQLRTDYPDYAGRNQGVYELAVALQNLGKVAEAQQLFANVAASDNSPLAYRARFMEGEMQFAAKDYQQAVRTFFQVFAGSANADLGDEYHTWQAESMFEAARCLEQLDRGEAARNLYADLVQRFPDHPKAELARKQLGQ